MLLCARAFVAYTLGSLHIHGSILGRHRWSGTFMFYIGRAVGLVLRPIFHHYAVLGEFLKVKRSASIAVVKGSHVEHCVQMTEANRFLNRLQGWVDLGGWRQSLVTYGDSLPARRQSPVRAVTRPGMEKLHWWSTNVLFTTPRQSIMLPDHHRHDHVRLFKVVKRNLTYSSSSPVNTWVPSYSKTFSSVQSVVCCRQYT